MPSRSCGARFDLSISINSLPSAQRISKLHIAAIAHSTVTLFHGAWRLSSACQYCPFLCLQNSKSHWLQA